MDGSVCLVPTFQPPSGRLGRNQSNFDRLAMLLNGFAPVAGQSSNIAPTASHQSHIAKVQLVEQHSAPSSRGGTAPNVFELFDGEIVVAQSTQQASPRAASANPTIAATPKLSVFQSNSSSQKHLSSILGDNNLDPKTAVYSSSKGEKRKAPSTEVSASNSSRQSSQTVPHGFSTQDFVGIEKFCRNAGGSSTGISALVQNIKAAKAVVLSVVWSDLSCNHATTTAKYCTASTKCAHWNCTCDRQVRANFVASNAIGLVLRLPTESETVYFLPLKECFSAADFTAVRGASGALPMGCGTSLSERVAAMISVLSDPTVLKILYHTQVALIPLLHLAAAHLPAQAPPQQHHPQRFCLELVANVFDPRMAAYLCDSDIAEAQLEAESLFDKYNTSRTTPVAAGAQSHSGWNASGAAGMVANSNRLAVAGDVSVAGLGRVARTVHRVKGELADLLALYAVLDREMAHRNVAQIFRDIEMPVACLLAQIELRGVAVDPSFLDEVRLKVTQRITDTEMQIFASVGEANRFNVASPEQVSRVLFDVLGLPPPASSSKKGKHHSTSEEDLLKLRAAHPVVDLILSYRALAKTLSTYVDGMRPFLFKEKASSGVHPSQPPSFFDDIPASTNSSNAFSLLMNQARDAAAESQASAKLHHRVHANWQQTVVRTGRLSCTKPNLQNIPNKQVVARLEINMRSAFRASHGHVLVSADYSQIEMRVLAHLCKDPVLLGLFSAAQGYDIYRHLAAKILNQPVADVPEEDRTKAKVICLGVLYGMGAQAAAAKLEIDVAAASRITQAFFDHFKQIKVWIQQIKAQAKQHGYVRTLLGRVRSLPDIRSADIAKASYAERQAVNSVIQGTASDLIKYAMVNVDRQLAARWPADAPAPRLLMQIHDELIYEVSTAGASYVESFEALLHGAMEEDVVRALKLTVPLIANVHTGMSWGDVDG